MKQLTDEIARVIRGKNPGKDIAFVVVRDEVGPFHKLGYVIKNEPGYVPVPHQLAYGPEAAMEANAEHLNDQVLHLTQSQVDAFVAESFIQPRRGAY